ncbi:hypothetical protein CDAR_536231 [Caerostris darwini]|uniref:Uncharacterized protein n=1 Tax=Caerostris darwini TaxID=1538125 RepID=A0AAV4V6U1_9ARAC|nr:hypothetical protein CDAR_536231 [Caerostris darwini]
MNPIEHLWDINERGELLSAITHLKYLPACNAIRCHRERWKREREWLESVAAASAGKAALSTPTNPKMTSNRRAFDVQKLA